MRNGKSSRKADKHRAFGYPGAPYEKARESAEMDGVNETRFEEIAPPIYTGPLPTPPETAVPPIYTGPLPIPPETAVPPIYTGPLPTPPGSTRPPGTRPPVTRPPAYGIPPYGQLPQLDITLRSDQSLGVGDCLAPSSVIYAPQLEEYIRQELRIYLSFYAWADRYPSRRTELRALAAENLERAKILLRAYSFITDTYYWPTYLQPLVSFTNYSREMRQLYNEVGDLQRSYQTAYRRSLDSCLASVYAGLANRASSQRQRMSRVL